VANGPQYYGMTGLFSPFRVPDNGGNLPRSRGWHGHSLIRCMPYLPVRCGAPEQGRPLGSGFVQKGYEFLCTEKQASLAGAANQPDDVSVVGTSVDDATEVHFSSTAERHTLALF
jgi:hypothetical protein